MPWKECHIMDERLRFVARLLEGEKMAPLCAAFGISRKTGYKIFDRYKDCGVRAFTDRSRRPYRQANRLPPQLEAVIVRLKREYPGWGAPKIREKLRRQSMRSRSTIYRPQSSTRSGPMIPCGGGQDSADPGTGVIMRTGGEVVRSCLAVSRRNPGRRPVARLSRPVERVL